MPLNISSAQTFKPAGLPTLIGSIPLNEHKAALNWIFEFTPEIPLWPQLPSHPLEGMLNQFVENFPGLVEGHERTYVNTDTPDFENSLLTFFEKYLAVSEDHSLLKESDFRLSRERANGLYVLKEDAAVREIQAVKGQITGPFTMLTGLSDKDHKLAYYIPAIREMIVKGLALRAAWQVDFLKELGFPVLLFIDEPALAGLGSSSYITLSLDDIGQDISEVANSVQQAGGLAGVHVCANTDWEFLLSLNLDIISFDAYSFFDRFIISRDDILKFLDRGGIIAWGLVPTSENEFILNESAESLAQRWQKQAGQLANDKWGLPDILDRTLITPSCGTGSLLPDLARRVLELTRDVSKILRDKSL